MKEFEKFRVSTLFVLIVDDDEMIRSIIIKMLRAVGFQRFLEASNGAEAHKFVLDPMQKVDLILCDWDMPRVDGLTLLRAIRGRRSHSDIPFIMVTSQQSQERLKITKAKQYDVNAYIVKPFHARVLYDKVLEVLLAAAQENSA